MAIQGTDRKQQEPVGDTCARLKLAAEHYLTTCYAKKTAVRVDEFANELGVTRPYLSRLALDVLGQPVGDFLRSQQLAYAERLLRVTPLAVSEIAIAAGFGTKWTFFRAFRKAYGQTPSVWRESYQMRLAARGAAPDNAEPHR